MTTSLASQLRRLEAPQTSILSQKHGKASFLFEKNEAACLEKDTAFCLGVNGLEELILVDRDFELFQKNLFNESSKSFERAVLSKDLNKIVDESLDKFLFLLSPFVLMRPAHKAIEWLVYRFNIHLYNVDSYIRCFLPFHGTNIFVRAIQLLNLSSSKMWSWLEPIQKSNIPLAKNAILNHAAKNLEFLKFICGMMEPLMQEKDLDKGKKFQMMIAFCASSVVGVLHQCDKLQEELVAALLPFVLKCLQSSLPDIVCTGLMIISEMAIKSYLTPDLLQVLVIRVSKVVGSELCDEASMCLLTIYQSQKYDTFPKKAFKYIVKCSTFMESLFCVVGEKFDVNPLVGPILRRSLDQAIKSNLGSQKPMVKNVKKTVPDPKVAVAKYLKFTKMIVGHKLDADIVRAGISKILKVFLKHQQKQKEEGEKKGGKKKLKKLEFVIGSLLAMFEARYPDIFDEVMTSTFEDFPKTLLQIRQLLSSPFSLNLVKVDSMSKETSLYLNLNDPRKIQRRDAVALLLQKVKNKKEDNKKFVSEALLARLSDEYYRIPRLILKHRKILCKYVPALQLFETVQKFLNRKWDNETLLIQAKMTRETLGFLCSKDLVSRLPTELIESLIIVLLPYVLPVEKSEIGTTIEIANSHLFKNNSALIQLGENLTSTATNKVQEMFEERIAVIADQLIQHDRAICLAFISQLISKTSEQLGRQSHFCVITISLLSRLTAVSEDDDAITFGQILTDFCCKCLSFETRNPGGAKLLSCGSTAAELKSCLKLVKNNKLPMEMVISGLTVVIKSIVIPRGMLDRVWWSADLDENHKSILFLLVRIFDLSVERANGNKPDVLFRQFLKLFFATHFQKAEVLIKFLGHVWTGPTQTIHGLSTATSMVCQARALAIGTVFFQSTRNKLKWMEEKANFVAVLALVVLDSSHPSIRSLALTCMERMLERRVTFGYSVLFKKLVKHRTEIEMDAEQICQVVATTLHHSSNRGRLLESLLETVVSSDTPDFIKASLLKILGDTDSSQMLTTTVDLLVGMIDGKEANSPISKSEGIIIECLLSRFTPEVAMLFEANPKLFGAFKLALKSLLVVPHCQATCQMLALKQVKKELFNSLDESCRQELLSIMIDLQSENKDPELTSMLSRKLKKLFVDVSYIVFQLNKPLEKNCGVGVQNSVRSVMKQRQLEESELTSMSKIRSKSEQWRRVYFVLEIIHAKKKIENVQLLVPVLFEVLKRCLEFEELELAEDVIQLVLLCLHQCCMKLSPDGKRVAPDVLCEADVGIELLVRCLRLSTDKQTHSNALMLLGLMANMFPETVLHNVIAIFTFMGTNVLRQDDLYSFQIMARTISAVVPAILSHDGTKEAEALVLLVVRIFVDALPDIPGHRRLPVFVQLLDTLDAKTFLGMVVALLVEHNVTKYKSMTMNDSGHDVKGKKSSSQPNSPVKFAKELLVHYSPLVQMSACVRLVQYLKALPMERCDATASQQQSKRLTNSKRSVVSIFDSPHTTPKELRHITLLCVTLLSNVLGDKNFVQKVADVDEKTLQEMEKLLESLLEDVLQFSNFVVRMVTALASKPTLKYWKTLLQRVYEVLDKVNALLPGSSFVSVVTRLMESELPIVRRKAMELLSSRLHYHPNTFQENETSSLVVLIDPLLAVIGFKIKKCTDDEVEEFSLNKQVALYTMKLLCRSLEHQHLEKMNQVLTVVTCVFLKNKGKQNALCGSALLCLVEVCRCLGAHCIGSLNKFAPDVVSLYEDTDGLFRNEQFLMSIVTSVGRLVEILPHFIGPYVRSFVKGTCILSGDERGAQKSDLMAKLKTLRHNLATLIPPRVLLPSIKLSFDELSVNNTRCLGALMEVLKECVGSMDAELVFHTSQLQTFFLECLHYRENHQRESLDVITSTEGEIIESAVCFAVKLSEHSFRPFFFKLCDWATQPECRDRLITIYHLSAKMAGRLKSLFLFFAGHLIPNATRLLDDVNAAKNGDGFFESEAKTQLLLSFVLDYLRQCFLFDKNGDFVNKEIFDSVMQPMVDQIENKLANEEEEVFEKRILQQVAPSISQLAVAVNDDDCCKRLNNQILLKTRDESPRIRFASLVVVQELNRKLQPEKNYLSLLNDTIPFLSELMEDESPEVEHQCQLVIADLEKSLGEPIQNLFL